MKFTIEHEYIPSWDTTVYRLLAVNTNSDIESHHIEIIGWNHGDDIDPKMVMNNESIRMITNLHPDWSLSVVEFKGDLFWYTKDNGIIESITL